MTHLALSSLAAAACLLATLEVAAQCTMDLDCKGARICEDGTCIDPIVPPKPPAKADPQPLPATPPAPPPGPPPPLKPFQSGYAEVAFFISVYTFGGQTWDIDGSPLADPQFDATTKVLPGARFAGYGALGESFHLGGYFAIRAGEGELEPANRVARAMFLERDADSDVKTWGLGLALKAGGRVAERLWLGGGLDVGVHFFLIEEWDDADNDTFVGLELFPRIALDIILVDRGGVRLAVPISVGAVVSPIAVVEPEEDDPQTTVRMWSVAPAATVGLALGS
jgi:hypothetical protein